jgi:FdhD protein
MHPASQSIRILQVSPGKKESIGTMVVTEALVTLTVNGDLWLTFSCTPTMIDALAVGFLFNEGIIQSIAEVAVVHPCDDYSNVDVWLDHPVVKPANWTRTSGCSGGITRLEIIPELVPPGGRFSTDLVFSGMERLQKNQEIYQETGGLHSSGLSDGFNLWLQTEDIGRHNTLDKLAGLLTINKINHDHCMLFTTGRISSEMLQKAARMQAVVVVSRTSPTGNAIALAEKSGITLVGYARRSQFNVYSHAERLFD